MLRLSLLRHILARQVVAHATLCHTHKGVRQQKTGEIMRRLTAIAGGLVAISALAWGPPAQAVIVDPPSCETADSMASPGVSRTVVVPEKCYLEGTIITVGGEQLAVPADLESVTVSWMNDETGTSGSSGQAWLARDDGDKLEIGYISGSSSANTLTAAAAGRKCIDSTYSYSGSKNPGMTYRVNTGNRPSGVSLSDWTTEIALAESTWEVGTNACGYATGSSLFTTSFTRGADTTARAMNSSAACVLDGANTIDFGAMPASHPERIAQTCVRSYWMFGWRIREADVRLKQSAIWFKYIPSGCSGKYEMAGVLTHEFGHTLGFNDLMEIYQPDLTMSSKATPCSYQDRTLGRADYLGLKNVYGA